MPGCSAESVRRVVPAFRRRASVQTLTYGGSGLRCCLGCGQDRATRTAPCLNGEEHYRWEKEEWLCHF